MLAAGTYKHEPNMIFPDDKQNVLNHAVFSTLLCVFLDILKLRFGGLQWLILSIENLLPALARYQDQFEVDFIGIQRRRNHILTLCESNNIACCSHDAVFKIINVLTKQKGAYP